MWEGRIQIKRSQQILWTKINEVKFYRYYAQVPKISTAQILKEKDLLKDGLWKNPSNLASLKLMMSPQNCVDAWKANAILSPINRVLLSRFNLDSRYSILWPMTAFSKVFWNIPCYMGVWWSYILRITFSGFPFRRCTEFISILKVVTSAVIKAFLNYSARKCLFGFCFVFCVVQSLSHVQLFATPWTAAHQASLSFTISWSLLKFMSIELVMPSNHLILCLPLLLLPPIFPSIRVFSNELALCIRWPKYWSFSFSFSIGPSNEYSGFPLRLTGLISLQYKGLWRVFSKTTIQKHHFFSAQPSLWFNSHICTWLLEKP